MFNGVAVTVKCCYPSSLHERCIEWYHRGPFSSMVAPRGPESKIKFLI